MSARSSAVRRRRWCRAIAAYRPSALPRSSPRSSAMRSCAAWMRNFRFTDLRCTRAIRLPRICRRWKCTDLAASTGVPSRRCGACWSNEVSAMPGFVHLRLHSEYSLADSVIRIPELVEAVAAAGMPAVALTDQGNVFALVKFFRAAEAAGIKPLVGADMRLRDTEADGSSRCTLLCCDARGYRNLSQLITRSYLEGQQRGLPVLERAWLAERCDGLIALSGGREGEIGRALLGGHDSQAQALLQDWMHWFPQRFYLEIQRTGREGEEEYLRAAVALAAQIGRASCRERV